MEKICITELISDFPENVVPGMETQLEGRAYKLLLAMMRGTKTPLTLAEFIPEYALKLRIPKASVTSTREKKPTKYRTCNDDADDTQQTDYENFDYSENDEGGDDFIEEDIEDEVEEDSSRRFTFHGKEELRAVMGEGIFVSTPIKYHYLLILSNENLAHLYNTSRDNLSFCQLVSAILVERNEGLIRNIIAGKCGYLPADQMNDYVQNAKLRILLALDEGKYNQPGTSLRKGSNPFDLRFGTFIGRHIFTAIDEQNAANNGVSLHTYRQVKNLTSASAKSEKRTLTVEDLCETCNFGPRSYSHINTAAKAINGHSIDSGTYDTVIADNSDPESEFMEKERLGDIQRRVRKAVMDLGLLFPGEEEIATEVFFKHYAEGETNVSLAARLGIEPTKVASILRIAKPYFKNNPEVAAFNKEQKRVFSSIRSHILSLSQVDAVNKAADEITEDIIQERERILMDRRYEMYSAYLDELYEKQGTDLVPVYRKRSEFRRVTAGKESQWIPISNGVMEIGFLIVGTHPNCHPDADYYIEEAYVVPSARGKGYMTRTFNNFIREHKGTYCYFVLTKNDKAKAFWEKRFAKLNYEPLPLRDVGAANEHCVQYGCRPCF